MVNADLLQSFHIQYRILKFSPRGAAMELALGWPRGRAVSPRVAHTAPHTWWSCSQAVLGVLCTHGKQNWKRIKYSPLNPNQGSRDSSQCNNMHENKGCYRNRVQEPSTTWLPNQLVVLLKRRKLYTDLWKYEDITKLKIMCKKSELHFRIWDGNRKNIWTPDVRCECEQSIPGAPIASARCLNLILNLACFSSMNEHLAESSPLPADAPHCGCSRINVPRFYCGFKKVLKNTLSQSNTQGTYARELQSH